MRGRAPQTGATPLYVAAYNGHDKVVQLLVKEGADKDAPTKVTVGRG
jgi:ankyrin repeat protein